MRLTVCSLMGYLIHPVKQLKASNPGLQPKAHDHNLYDVACRGVLRLQNSVFDADLAWSR